MRIKFYSFLISSLFLISAYNAFSQQTGKITGTIVDEKGEPLPGATIKIVELNKFSQSNVNGVFTTTTPVGSYTIEISFFSYQTKKFTGVQVKNNDVASLTISLKPQTNQLQEVVVIGDYRKASSEGLLMRQKNAVNITSGISADQISKTPDSNIGQVLKRVSGLTTTDNKYVIVRGIAERYNVAMVDGAPMPSTDMVRRNFSFDLIPSDMIENVVVSKTVTPDMISGFGGGLIQVSTRDIPVSNFMNFAVGVGFNNQSIGKDFVSPNRGKYDYLGYDDGGRNFPKNFATSNFSLGNTLPNAEDFERSKSFSNNWNLYKYQSQPNQNYAFSIGRVIDLKNDKKFGVVAAINYRNTQSIDNIVNFRGNQGPTIAEFALNPTPTDWSKGRRYDFNTTLGGLINVGIRTKNTQLSFRNMYNRIFSNPTYESFGYDKNLSAADYRQPFNNLTYSSEPDFLTLIQNKLMGENQIAKKIKFKWDVSRSDIDRVLKDQLLREMVAINPQLGFTDFADNISIGTDYGYLPNSRHYFTLKETDYNWSTSIQGTMIEKGAFSNSLKIGYNGFDKKQRFTYKSAIIRKVGDVTNYSKYLNTRLEDIHIAENFNPDGLLYYVPFFANDFYDGVSTGHGGFVMLDQKLFEKFRLVGGLRGEYFVIDIANNKSNVGTTVKKVLDNTFDKKFSILPSANLTYSLNDKINLRTSYSQSLVRPEFNEKSEVQRFNPLLGGNVSGSNVTSTKITSYDVRAELYPALGEVISIGGFYKYLARPLELEREATNSGYVYTFINSAFAKNYGLELEIRKNLDFIGSSKWLKNLTFSANGTLIKSTVQTVIRTKDEERSTENVFYFKEIYRNDKRPLYGQTPYLINASLQYQGENYGANFSFNRSGRKLIILDSRELRQQQYESPLSQFDVQFSRSFMKKKGIIKLNIANLLDNYNFAYENSKSYDVNAPEKGLLPGFTNNYELGDQYMFSSRQGRTISLSLGYKF